MNKITYIYALKDPDTDLVRYIGKTVNKPRARFLEHVKRAELKRTHKDNWILKLKGCNKLPILEILDEVEDWKEGLKAEITYIKLFKSLGADLCNHTDGGDGMLGYKHTEEFKLNLSKRLAENPIFISEETRKLMGKRHSEFLKTHPEKCYLHTLHKDKDKIKEIYELANKASVAATSKKVYEIDKDKNIICVFNSVAEVARLHGNIDSSIIAYCARKNSKEGRSLKYKNHIYTYEVNNLSYKRSYNKGYSKAIEVIDGDNVTIYSSLRDFCRKSNMCDGNATYISKLIKSGKQYKHFKIKFV